MLVVCVMLPLEVERQALHLPSPSSISSTTMRIPEEEGLHFRPSSSYCGYTLAMLHRALQRVAVGIHPESCRRDKWCSDKKTQYMLFPLAGETFQGRCFAHRARVHRHGVSCRCGKRRLQPAGDPEYWQRAECALTTCLSRR